MQGWAVDEALCVAMAEPAPPRARRPLTPCARVCRPQRANRRRRRTEDAAIGQSPEPRGSSSVACAAADADGSADVGTAGVADSAAASPAFAAAGSGQLDDAPVQYEYLDHTADVQIHSWGATLTEAFEQQVVGMMGLVTDLSTVNVDPSLEREVVVEGHDLESLLFHLLDEWLCAAATSHH